MVECMNEIEFETFQEFRKVISHKINYHPSERVNRDFSLNDNSINSIYDIINSYHLYCLICCSHYYTQSVTNDINSFFQKHQNSSYHRARRLTENYPDDKPIFVWEKWLYTGRCNICNISDIEANVINAILTPYNYAKLHQCFYEKKHKDDNKKVEKKVGLLRKFCGLNSFAKKFISDIGDNRVVCLLCGFQNNGTIQSYQYHLYSDEHFLNFCKIIWNNFNFELIDLMNGFNLQLVANWLLSQNLNVSQKNYTICKDRENCIKESNNELDVYMGIERNSSFSPKQVEDLLKFDCVDLIFNDKCLICDVVVDPNHMVTNSHIEKAGSMSIENFEKCKEYKIYVKNREKRLLPYFIQIKMYRKLENELAVYGLKMGMPLAPDFNVSITNTKSEANSTESKIKKLWVNSKEMPQKLDYFREIITKKEALLKSVFTKIDNNNNFCEICDRKVDKNSLVPHVLGKKHKHEIQKWDELKLEFSNSKYFEPFMKISKALVCLICGVVFGENLLFHHLKTSTHNLNFKSYTSIKSTSPILSSFSLESDNRLWGHCGALMNGLSADSNHFSLGSTFKNIMNQWPDHESLKTSTRHVAIPVNSNKSTSEKNQNVDNVNSLPCANQLDMKDNGKVCAKNIPFDFVSFQRTAKNIMDLFEDKIIQNVAINSGSLVDKIQKTKKGTLISSPDKSMMPKPTLVTPNAQTFMPSDFLKSWNTKRPFAFC